MIIENAVRKWSLPAPGHFAWQLLCFFSDPELHSLEADFKTGRESVFRRDGNLEANFNLEVSRYRSASRQTVNLEAEHGLEEKWAFQNRIRFREGGDSGSRIRYSGNARNLALWKAANLASKSRARHRGNPQIPHRKAADFEIGLGFDSETPFSCDGPRCPAKIHS
jgi:hypothetical protein